MYLTHPCISAFHNTDTLYIPECYIKVKVLLLSCVQLFATPWTVAHEAPLSMGFSRQEYWSGFPFPPPGALCSSGMDPQRPHLFSGVGRWVPISSSRGSPQLRDGPTPPAPLLWRWQVGSHFLLQGLSPAQGWTHTARTSSLALAGGFPFPPPGALCSSGMDPQRPHLFSGVGRWVP